RAAPRPRRRGGLPEPPPGDWRRPSARIGPGAAAAAVLSTRRAPPIRSRRMEAWEKIVREAVGASPFARKLGIACESVAPDRVAMRLPWTPEHVTIGDLVHGGAIAALVDAAATGAAWATRENAPGARGRPHPRRAALGARATRPGGKCGLGCPPRVARRS